MKYLIQLLDKTIVSFTSFICSLHPMGYSLILLLLILSSCTDKENTNQESTTQDMLIVFEDSEKLQTNTKPLIASYDNDLDLILIGSDYRLWYSEFLLDQQGFYPPDAMEQARDYAGSYYWNSNNNTYYLAKMGNTNDILFTIDTNLQYENLYNPEFREKYSKYGDTNILAEILYVGSITPLKRVYYDPTNNVQYIKELKLISTDYYRDFKTWERIDVSTDLPVYPELTYGTGTIITNSNNQKFSFFNGELVLRE